MKKMMMMKTYLFNKKNIRPEFIGNTNKVRMRIVDQTCLDGLLLNDSISLDDFNVLDKFQMDFNRSGMIGVRASSYSPRIGATHDTSSNDNDILRTKVNRCMSHLKMEGGSRCYSILLKIIKDQNLTRPHIEFIKNNVGEIVKPIKEFYESWGKS